MDEDAALFVGASIVIVFLVLVFAFTSSFNKAKDYENEKAKIEVCEGIEDSKSKANCIEALR